MWDKQNFKIAMRIWLIPRIASRHDMSHVKFYMLRTFMEIGMGTTWKLGFRYTDLNTKRLYALTY